MDIAVSNIIIISPNQTKKITFNKDRHISSEYKHSLHKFHIKTLIILLFNILLEHFYF